MTKKQENGEETTTLQRNYRVNTKARLLSLPVLLLFALLIPLAHASVLPANVYIQNTMANPAITYPSYLGIPACANTIGGVCIGNDVITGSNTLSGNLQVIGNLTVPSGTTLTTNGFYISATYKIKATGATISPGSSAAISAIGAAGDTSPPCPSLPYSGGSIPTSYGGSGGGGGGNYYSYGACGGNTIATGGAGGGNPGNVGQTGGVGSATTIPAITQANAILWCNNPSYLAGAAGGGGGRVGSGAAGTLGVCISANTIALGTLTLTGGSAAGGSNGGGGGGGVAVILYGSGGVTFTTNNIAGGSGGSAGGSNGAPGGNGGAGQIKASNLAHLNITIPIIYPFKFYTSNPAITYTLNSVVGATQTTLQTGTSLSYTPPSNQPTGLYNFSITQYNGISLYTLAFSLQVSMNDIGSNLGYTGGCAGPIQYFPNCANVPTWNAAPTSWYVQSDMSNSYGKANSIVSGSNRDIWSNANLTFTPNVLLSYGQFTPPISFTANLLNNPLISSITQTKFKLIASNTVPSAPYTRQFLALQTNNEQTLALMNTSTSVSLSMLFNNYTINNQTVTTGYNAFNEYLPTSNFINPSFYISTLITSSTNASYFPASNNFCGGFVNNTSPIRYLYLYLVSYAVGQGTTVNLQSNYGGANNGDYLQVLSGANPTYATVVQQVLISTQSFLVPLIIGNSYSAIVLSSGCQKIYSTPAASQVNPWNINIVASLPPPLNTPQVNATCVLAYNTTYAANTITCAGYDSKNLVNEWNISIYNSSGFLGYHLITSNVISAGTFFWQYYPISVQWGSITWRVVWNWGDPSSGSASGILQNIVNAGFTAPFDVFLTVVFLLVGIVIGNSTGGAGGGNTHKLSNTCFIEAFILFFMYMVGISSWIGLPANISLILFMIVLGLLGSRSEGGVQIGG